MPAVNVNDSVWVVADGVPVLAKVTRVDANTGNIDATLDASVGGGPQKNIPHASLATPAPALLRPTMVWYSDHSSETLTPGSTSHTATAPTAAAPQIKQGPNTRVAGAGTSVTFTVNATGYPTPTYQWRKNRVNIGGATSSTYTIASVATTDIASYDCVLTNSKGVLTSPPIFLFVQ